MWGPSEKCTSCGGTTIRECDDGDSSTGYSSVDWRCMDCGEICEEWIAERPVAAVRARPASTVASIRDDIAAALFIPVRKPAAAAIAASREEVA